MLDIIRFILFRHYSFTRAQSNMRRFIYVAGHSRILSCAWAYASVCVFSTNTQIGRLRSKHVFQDTKNASLIFPRIFPNFNWGGGKWVIKWMCECVFLYVCQTITNTHLRLFVNKMCVFVISHLFVIRKGKG